MPINIKDKPEYSGGLTREQFLYYENREVAKLILKGYSYEEILKEVTENNTFQYPSLVSYSKIASACYKRLMFPNDTRIIELVANGNSQLSKLALLYCMMLQNLVVRDFMIDVVGEKYRSGVLTFDKTDVNHFMLDLSMRVDSVGDWSETTISKIKGVLVKCLADAGFLTTIHSKELNPITADAELIDLIKDRGEFEFLQAFNEL